jgi:hypothetical protein
MHDKVVTRTFSDDRTMASGASVTWTHCSVFFEVTWNKSARPRGRACEKFASVVGYKRNVMRCQTPTASCYVAVPHEVIDFWEVRA